MEKTEKAARQGYETDLRRAISCIADVMLLTKWSGDQKRWLLVLSPRKSKDTPGVGSMDEATDFIMLKRKDGSKLYLEIDQHIEVLKVPTEKGYMFRVSTLRYIYAIWETPDVPLIGWHYHPDMEVSFPHVHIYDRTTEGEKAAGQKPHIVHKLHIPSGRVSLEEVIRFAVLELGVLPDKKQEKDWQDILSDTERRFEESKSWGKKPPGAKK